MILKLIQFYRNIKSGKYGWHGNYSDWQEAAANVTGYDAAAILQKVKTSTLKVKNGEAVYERDGMLFDRTEYSWPLLANLLAIGIDNGSKLSVIDFGGSLGSSYFQNRKYLQRFSRLQWGVVEQSNYVDAGNKEIANDELRFYQTIDEAITAQGLPHLLLMGCVLPYLPDPYAMLKTLAAKKIPYIILDNTYYHDRPGDRLTVQRVPPIYYEASYPAWFLDYEKVKQALSENYTILEEYTNEQFLYLQGRKIEYRGLMARAK